MKFTKMQGIGNDYVYMDFTKNSFDNIPEIARRLSNRNYGIGSDGLILIRPSDQADFMMDMYNADGSRSQMCGNGIRCVGKYVYDYGLTDQLQLKIETLSGIKELELILDGEEVSEVRVNMGSPIFKPSLIPVDIAEEKVMNYPIMVGDMEVEITAMSMGNPHAVVFVEDTSSVDIEKIGPLFEHHKVFPERVNTEFIQVVDRGRINMRVWERGSGETLACGTGACASVVACVMNGFTDEKVIVGLLGGELKIEYDRKKNIVYMTGPCVKVFDGEIDLTDKNK